MFSHNRFYYNTPTLGERTPPKKRFPRYQEDPPGTIAPNTLTQWPTSVQKEEDRNNAGTSNLQDN